MPVLVSTIRSFGTTLLAFGDLSGVFADKNVLEFTGEVLLVWF